MDNISNRKEACFITDRRKKKNIQDDDYSIDSNDSVNDDLMINVMENKESKEVDNQKKKDSLTTSNKNTNVNKRQSIDSNDKKHLVARNSIATTTSSVSSIPHFMLPTEASLQRETISFHERQRKSIALEKKLSGSSDKSKNLSSKNLSKQSTTSKSKNEMNSSSTKQLPRFMQPTKSYLQSLQPDPNIHPRKSIPASRIREVDTNNLPRYMKPTKAALHHLSEEKRKNEEESKKTETERVRVFIEPLSRRQPISSHDEVAINELRRELEKVLEDSKRDLRLSEGEYKCTAIKKREGDLENEEEINERVKNAMKKIYPRYMQLTEAYRQKYKNIQK